MSPKTSVSTLHNWIAWLFSFIFQKYRSRLGSRCSNFQNSNVAITRLKWQHQCSSPDVSPRRTSILLSSKIRGLRSLARSFRHDVMSTVNKICSRDRLLLIYFCSRRRCLHRWFIATGWVNVRHWQCIQVANDSVAASALIAYTRTKANELTHDGTRENRVWINENSVHVARHRLRQRRWTVNCSVRANKNKMNETRRKEKLVAKEWTNDTRKEESKWIARC